MPLSFSISNTVNINKLIHGRIIYLLFFNNYCTVPRIKQKRLGFLSLKKTCKKC